MIPILDMRILFELENARLAARNRTDEQAEEFRQLLRQEQNAAQEDVDRLTGLDFQFHLLLALATDNPSYPLILNSFKQVYTHLTGLFFSRPSVIPKVLDYHRSVVDAIEKQDPEMAVDIMNQLLAHGEKILKEIMAM